MMFSLITSFLLVFPGGDSIRGGCGNQGPASTHVSHDHGRAGLRIQPALQKVPRGPVHPLRGPRLPGRARGIEIQRSSYRGDRAGLPGASLAQINSTGLHETV